MNKIVLSEILISSIVVAILHKVALSLYFYWTTDWYDIMMHFLGGAVIAFITFTIFISFFKNYQKDFWLNFYFTILGVLVIGLGWELWELFVGFTDPLSDRLDSIIDLIMDLAGGFVAFRYAFNKLLKK